MVGFEHVCVYPRAVTHWLCVHEQSRTWKKAMEGTNKQALWQALGEHGGVCYSLQAVLS